MGKPLRLLLGVLPVGLGLLACAEEHGLPSTPDEGLAGERPPGSVTASSIAAFGWQSLRQMPTGVRAGAAAWDGTRIYLFGGDAGAGPISITQIYRPSTNTWTTGARFSGARAFAVAAALSDGIHLIGGVGRSLLGDHQVYSPSTNTWSTRASLPIPVDAAVAQVIGGKVYVVGGGSASGPSNAVQIFDPATNSWSLGAPMPTARLSMASGATGVGIYVAGGQTANFGTSAALELYDTQLNSWQTLAPVPGAAEALGGGMVNGAGPNGSFCVFGGRLTNPNPTGNSFAQSYCYSGGSWSAGPSMLTPRVEIGSVTAGNVVYALGGRPRVGFATPANERLGAASQSALDFNQSYVNVPDNPALDLISQWTLEAWVFPRAAGNGADQDIISKWAGASDAAYIMQIDRTGVLRVVTNDGANQTIALSNTALVNGAWQHVAATFDNGTIKLFINGILDRTITGALVPINSSQPVAFGREGNFAGGTLNGMIDEVRLWNVVRSPSDLMAFKNQRLSGSEPGLVGYWRFDEGSGQRVWDGTGGGKSGRLGTSNGADSWDPMWTSNAPVLQ